MTRLSYKKSGVDIARGDRVSRDAFSKLQQTFTQQTKIFGNIVAVSLPSARNQYLALAADGVGTKLQYIYGTNQAFNVGIDVVAMCVNDLARNNITPTAFALYRAADRFNEKEMSAVASGVVSACVQSECVYTTGESAEMPDIYQKGEFDLAGFATGIFEKNELITGAKIKEGDILIGLASSGLHSNGFSLVRKIFPPEKIKKNSKLHQEIITPTKIYVKSILDASKKFEISAWAHITGGGLFGKLSKIVPDGLAVSLAAGSWEIPEIFQKIASKGKLDQKEMYQTFNMGLGFIGIARPNEIGKIVKFLQQKGEAVYVVGEVTKANSKQKINLIN